MAVQVGGEFLTVKAFAPGRWVRVELQEEEKDESGLVSIRVTQEDTARICDGLRLLMREYGSTPELNSLLANINDV